MAATDLKVAKEAVKAIRPAARCVNTRDTPASGKTYKIMDGAERLGAGRGCYTHTEVWRQALAYLNSLMA